MHIRRKGAIADVDYYSRASGIISSSEDDFALSVGNLLRSKQRRRSTTSIASGAAAAAATALAAGKSPRPSRKEVHEYAVYLGIDPRKEGSLLWIAEQALMSPLPEGWSAHTDNNGYVFYHNHRTQQSQYEHPIEDVYRTKVVKHREKASKEAKLKEKLKEASERRKKEEEERKGSERGLGAVESVESVEATSEGRSWADQEDAVDDGDGEGSTKAFRQSTAGEGSEEGENSGGTKRTRSSTDDSREVEVEIGFLAEAEEGSGRASPASTNSTDSRPSLFRWKGCVAYNASSRYMGDFYKEKRHGYGVMVFEDGSWYKGQWVQDQIEGKGVRKYSNGDVYIGMWKSGCMWGYGEYHYAAGNVYRGRMKSNLIFGHGVLYYVDGDVFHGEWKNNKKHGPGLYLYADGDRYAGKYWDNHKSGHGVWVKPSGEKELIECREGELLSDHSGTEKEPEVDIRFVLDRSMKASTRATRAERMAEAVEREIEMMIGRHRHYEEWDVSKEAEPMDEEEVLELEAALELGEYVCREDGTVMKSSGGTVQKGELAVLSGYSSMESESDGNFSDSTARHRQKRFEELQRIARSLHRKQGGKGGSSIASVESITPRELKNNRRVEFLDPGAQPPEDNDGFGSALQNAVASPEARIDERQRGKGRGKGKGKETKEKEKVDAQRLAPSSVRPILKRVSLLQREYAQSSPSSSPVVTPSSSRSNSFAKPALTTVAEEEVAEKEEKAEAVKARGSEATKQTVEDETNLAKSASEKENGAPSESIDISEPSSSSAVKKTETRDTVLPKADDGNIATASVSKEGEKTPSKAERKPPLKKSQSAKSFAAVKTVGKVGVNVFEREVTSFEEFEPLSRSTAQLRCSQRLGIGDDEKNLLWIVDAVLRSPLPDGWTIIERIVRRRSLDGSSPPLPPTAPASSQPLSSSFMTNPLETENTVLFENTATGERSEAHPREQDYRALVRTLREREEEGKTPMTPSTAMRSMGRAAAFDEEFGARLSSSPSLSSPVPVSSRSQSARDREERSSSAKRRGALDNSFTSISDDDLFREKSDSEGPSETESVEARRLLSRVEEFGEGEADRRVAALLQGLRGASKERRRELLREIRSALQEEKDEEEKGNEGEKVVPEIEKTTVSEDKASSATNTKVKSASVEEEAVLKEIEETRKRTTEEMRREREELEKQMKSLREERERLEAVKTKREKRELDAERRLPITMVAVTIAICLLVFAWLQFVLH